MASEDARQKFETIVRRCGHDVLRHRLIILECEDIKPSGEYHGEPVYDGQEMMGAELLAIEKLADVVRPFMELAESAGRSAGLEEAVQIIMKDSCSRPECTIWIHQFQQERAAAIRQRKEGSKP